MLQTISKSRYPDDWKQIAHSIKQCEGWHCYRCGVRCLRSGERLFSAKDRAFLIQVHHWDCNPSQMHHQRHGSIAIGQGVLPFEVERRFPRRSAPKIPLAVQLGLWMDGRGFRQLELDM